MKGCAINVALQAGLTRGRSKWPLSTNRQKYVNLFINHPPSKRGVVWGAPPPPLSTIYSVSLFRVTRAMFIAAYGAVALLFVTELCLELVNDLILAGRKPYYNVTAVN